MGACVMRPRLRYNASLAALAGVLLIAGTEMHRRAFRARLGVLERRLEAIESSAGGLGDNRPPDRAVSPPESESQGAEPSMSMPPLERPRILGWGRSVGRVYCDVRYADGEQRRYYCRTNAPRAEVVWMVDQMASDAREHGRKISLDYEGALW